MRERRRCAHSHYQGVAGRGLDRNACLEPLPDACPTSCRLARGCCCLRQGRSRDMCASARPDPPAIRIHTVPHAGMPPAATAIPGPLTLSAAPKLTLSTTSDASSASAEACRLQVTPGPAAVPSFVQLRAVGDQVEAAAFDKGSLEHPGRIKRPQRRCGRNDDMPAGVPIARRTAAARGYARRELRPGVRPARDTGTPSGRSRRKDLPRRIRRVRRPDRPLCRNLRNRRCG